MAVTRPEDVKSVQDAIAYEEYKKSLTADAVAPVTTTPSTTTAEAPTSAYDPTSELTNYRSSLGTYTSPIVDPYVRNYLTQNIDPGQGMPYIDWQAEEQKRLAAMQASITSGSEAVVAQGLRSAADIYQQAGKLSSSAATKGLIRTSELYAGEQARQLSQGYLGVYEGIGQERSSYYGQLAETQRTNIQVNAQKQIAAIQNETALKIAEIERDTTLTGYEKDIAIATINSKTDQSIANVNNQTQLQLGEMSSSTAITLKGMDINLQLNPETGKPWTVEQYYAGLKQNQIQFDTAEENDMTKFWENLKWMRDSGEMEDERIRELAANQIQNDWNMFKLTDQKEREMFRKNLDLMRDQFESDDAYKKWEMKFTEDSFWEQMRQQDMTLVENMRQFNEQLAWAKKENYISDTLQRDLQRNAIMEQARQWNLTNDPANELSQWSQAFNESVRATNLTAGQNLFLGMEALDIQREQLKGTELATQIEATLAILNSDYIQNFLDKQDSTVSAEFITFMMQGIATGKMPDNPADLLDALKKLQTEAKKTGKPVDELSEEWWDAIDEVGGKD